MVKHEAFPLGRGRSKPKREPSILQRELSIPKREAAIPKRERPIPKRERPIPKRERPILKRERPIPKRETSHRRGNCFTTAAQRAVLWERGAGAG